MTSIEADLVRVVVHTPQRRMDVALPTGVPVSAVLPVLLRHGGSGLADLGAAHGGWLLRRIDGSAIQADDTIADLELRHGEELVLGLADEWWPPLDYDDAPAAIASASGRRGPRWDRSATRFTAIATAALLLGAGLAAVITAGPPWSPATGVSATLAVVLLAAAVVIARAYGDVAGGVAIGAMSLPYGFVGALIGSRLLDPRYRDGTSIADLIAPAPLSVAGAALAILALAASAGIGRRSPVFVAGVLIGIADIFAALIWATGLAVGGAAAVLLGVLVLGFGLAPTIAIWLGGVPRPEPADGMPTAAAVRPAWAIDLDPLLAAVARADDVLAGACAALALGLAQSLPFRFGS